MSTDGSEPIDIPIPIPGDKEMSGENEFAAVDIDDDRCNIALSESLDMHDAQMSEANGNIISASGILTHTGVRKYNQEDPIEAASAEMILKPNTP